ncbi:deoxynucleotidyltransferase terminal-interacting protein 2-like [Gigantopelta aegis]|uniref:deoxynucleotidyltransferase terminal-interacting protein 2-like n=1 Tax=Gigantopelta aegis TaxID=1735272 RepID=UPI001B8883E4|nr:deoxynucleotidyltransferase terminal-interacting protein 2-like [Gigantopelta aegis]
MTGSVPRHTWISRSMAFSSSSSSSESEIDDIVEAALIEMKTTLDKRIAHENDLKLKNIQLEDGTFIIDNKPSSLTRSPCKTTFMTHNVSEETCERLHISDSSDDDNVKKIEVPKKGRSTKLASSLQVSADLSDLYVDVNTAKKAKNIAPSSSKVFSKLDRDAEVMKKSVITPDFEKKFVIPPYQESFRQEKKQRKVEREKTKGKGWFGLPATELDDEKKNDLLALQMRRALDPKRFYKNNDLKGLPKYYQFGTVIESPTEFYSARIPKKQRKKTIVDELLADAEFRKYNKRKYTEIQDAKRRGIGPYQHIKRIKKRKK